MLVIIDKKQFKYPYEHIYIVNEIRVQSFFRSNNAFNCLIWTILYKSSYVNISFFLQRYFSLVSLAGWCHNPNKFEISSAKFLNVLHKVFEIARVSR